MIFIEAIDKKKREKNIYIVKLSDGKVFEISDELMIKYRFKLGDAYDEGSLCMAEKETSFFRAKEAALKYLKNRSRTIQEISTYLNEKKFQEDAIERTLAFLQEYKFVDDTAMTGSYIMDAMNKGIGPLRIQYELQSKGVDAEIIDTCMYKLLPYDKVYKIALETAKNKLGNQTRDEKNYSKIARYLGSKGYEEEMIYEILQKLFNI